MSKYKLVFVCTGNTCRSPMAEVIFKNLAKQIGLENVLCKSAGLKVNDGDKINKNAKLALKTLGYKAGEIKAKPLTSSMIKDYNVLVCLSNSHKKYIQESLCQKTAKKVATLNELTGCGEIEDPFNQELDKYILTAKQIEKGVVTLIKILKEGLKK